MSESFTDLSDYVLDQLLGYQDVNEILHNTFRLRDAFDDEHVWHNTTDSNLGNHEADFLVESYVADDSIHAGAMKVASVSVNAVGLIGNLSSSRYCFQGNLYRGGSPEYLGRWMSLGYYGLGFCDCASARCYYVQTSPPYALNKIDNWGHWLYLLRNKNTGEVLSVFEGEDPIWMNESLPYHKDDVIRIAKHPHPFIPYLLGPLPKDLEIVLVDCRKFSNLVPCGKAQINMQVMKEHRAEIIAKTDQSIEQVLANEKKYELTNLKTEQDSIDRFNYKIERLEKTKIDMIRKVNLMDITPAKKLELKMKFIPELDKKTDELKKYTRKRPMIQMIRDVLDKNNIPLIQAIRDGLLPEISEADEELSLEEQALLPQVEAFKSQVRVLKPCSSVKPIPTTVSSILLLKKPPVVEPKEEPIIVEEPKEESELVTEPII